jgi:hypothetical protein
VASHAPQDDGVDGPVQSQVSSSVEAVSAGVP